MLSRCVLLMLVLSVHESHSQSYIRRFSSDEVLHSGFMVGSGQERHNSARMLGFGADFAGVIDDHLTDLYRNPAYFALNEKADVFSELALQRYYYNLKTFPLTSSFSYASNYYDYNSFPDRSQLSSTLRVGYNSHFGVLVRGWRTSDESEQQEGRPYVGQQGETSGTFSNEVITRRTLFDGQVSYGFLASADIAIGFSYTYGNIRRRILASSHSDYLQVYSTASADSSFRSSLQSNGVSKFAYLHTMRAGVRFKGENSESDIVATLEFINSRLSDQYVERAEQTDIRNSPLYPRTIVGRSSKNHDDYPSEVKGTNVQLDARRATTIDDSRQFVAQARVAYATFSSEDFIQRFVVQSSISRDSIVRYATYSETNFNAASKPDGSGFRLGGTAAWLWKDGDLMFTAAASADVMRLTYRATENGVANDTSYWRQNNGRDTTYSTNRSRAYRHDHEYRIMNIRLALPIALEYSITESITMRVGWLPQYLYGSVNDDFQPTRLERTSDFIDVSTVNFGLGIHLFEQLRLDLVNYGNLATTRDWQVAAQYSL